MSVPQNNYQLAYLARMNVIYHESRERHYTRLIRWTAFVTVLLGSASVAALSDVLLPASLQSAASAWALAFGLVVTVCNAAALAFDWYGQLSLHARFRAKWTALAVESGVLEDGSDRPLGFEKLVRELATLNAEEPPAVERALKRAEALADEAFGRTSAAR